MYIQNDASHPVAFYVANVNMEHVYPDTALLSDKPPMRVIRPGESAAWDISYPFELFFPELPHDTLSVYVFHPDTLAAYEWPVIQAQYKVLRRYDLSLSYLQQHNYIIRYP